MPGRRLSLNKALQKNGKMQSLTFAVSLPTPVFAPVTIITLPDRSGMSSTVNDGLGGNIWLRLGIGIVCGYSSMESSELQLYRNVPGHLKLGL